MRAKKFDEKDIAMVRSTVLTRLQREQVMAFPHPDNARLIARSYLLSEKDLKFIRQQTSKTNQFAFTLYLCTLRYPGRIWQIDEELPEYLINLVSEQLALPISIFVDHQHDPSLRREQLRRLRQQFGFHLFNDTTKQLLRDSMMPTALSTDKAIVLMNVLLSKMRDEQIIIPAISRLEEFLHGIIQDANQQTYQALTDDLSHHQRKTLGLLLANRSDTNKSYIHWLQQPVGRVNAKNLLINSCFQLLNCPPLNLWARHTSA